jgi:class 3 adenylate cyclase
MNKALVLKAFISLCSSFKLEQRKRLLLVFFSTFLFLSFPSLSQEHDSQVKAIQGVLDLSNWNFDNQGPATLEGEWAFYWQSLLLVDSPVWNEALKPDAWFPVPRRWGYFKMPDGSELPARGYATLRLKVLMPTQADNKEKYLRLFLGSSDTSFRLQAFDTQGNPLTRTLKGGEVASSKEEYRAMWVRDSAPLTTANEIILIWHISNFDMLFDGGGPKKAPLIGLDKDITLTEENERSFNAITTGIMLIMGIYHLILFWMRKAEVAPLWFGLSCLFMALYSVLTPHYIEQNFPEADYFELLTKLLFLSGTLPMMFNLLFVKSLFPHLAGNYYWKWVIGLSSLYCAIIIIFPLSIYDWFRASMLVLGFLSAFWYAKVFLVAIFVEKDLIAFLLAAGFTFFGITAFSDLMVANAIFSLPYLSSYGLSTFVLFQALVIAIQNQKAHQEKYIAQKQAAESNRRALEVEKQALQEQKSLTQSFQRFVPKDFLKLLNKNKIQEVSLGDFTKQEMSILFCDIRSFTSLSESMSPEDNFRFLNSYLKRMEPIIRKNNGVIDKYIGDAIMAMFPYAANDAIQAAIEMLEELKLYNEHRANSGYKPIQIGIGINMGELMLGTIGGEMRMEGTVISDAVNLAARLEGLTKIYGASIAVSSYILQNASIEKFETRILDSVIVKGKSEAVTIYEILNAEGDELKQLKLQSNEFLLKAINQRREGQLEQAEHTLEIGLSFFPKDKALQKHKEDIHKLIVLGLPDNWQGATQLDSK